MTRAGSTLGSRGYGPLRAVLLGGVSRRLMVEAHCPVIVVPRGVEAGSRRWPRARALSRLRPDLP
jgi:hypothetical protein